MSDASCAAAQRSVRIALVVSAGPRAARPAFAVYSYVMARGRKIADGEPDAVRADQTVLAAYAGL